MPGAGSARAKLRGRAEFRRVIQGGSRAAGELVAVYVLSSQTETRTGFIAGRSIGGAVGRNKARRVMREAWRMVDLLIQPGTQVVLVARPGIRTARTPDVASELRMLLRKVGVTE
ncbi:MAG TPA: ribonuclease P protein component, partial [Actinomycetota bacterium]|nr:ribonuclease P protein component [Actinomycetota bacterium]